MSNIAQREQLPAHLQQAVQAGQPVTGFESINGIAIPAIKVSTLGIKIVDGTQVLAESSAGTTMDLVVLAASPLSRTFYRTERQYQKGSTDAPDCSSYDGRTPDAGRDNIQSSDCASCPQNIIGSDPKNANGRACRYRRSVVAFSPALPDKLLRLSLSATSMFKAPDVNGASTLEPYVAKLRTAGLQPHHVVTQIMQSPESEQTRVLFRRVSYTTPEIHEVATQHLTDSNAIQMALGNPQFFASAQSDEAHEPMEDAPHEETQAQAQSVPPVNNAPSESIVATDANVVLNYIPYQPIEVADEATYWRNTGDTKQIGIHVVPLLLEVPAGQPLPDEQWDELQADEYKTILEQQKILEQEAAPSSPPRRSRRAASAEQVAGTDASEVTASTSTQAQSVTPPKTRRTAPKATQSGGQEAGVVTNPKTQALNTAMTELFGEGD